MMQDSKFHFVLASRRYPTVTGTITGTISDWSDVPKSLKAIKEMVARLSQVELAMLEGTALRRIVNTEVYLLDFLVMILPRSIRPSPRVRYDFPLREVSQFSADTLGDLI
jgi:hypothetical protein